LILLLIKAKIKHFVIIIKLMLKSEES